MDFHKINQPGTFGLAAFHWGAPKEFWFCMALVTAFMAITFWTFWMNGFPVKFIRSSLGLPASDWDFVGEPNMSLFTVTVCPPDANGLFCVELEAFCVVCPPTSFSLCSYWEAKLIAWHQNQGVFYHFHTRYLAHYSASNSDYRLIS